MQIDKTTTVLGDGIFSTDLDVVELFMELTPAPDELTAIAIANTVSISHLYLDSGGGPSSESPDPDNLLLFYGVDTQFFGYGSYPLTGFQ